MEMTLTFPGCCMSVNYTGLNGQSSLKSEAIIDHKGKILLSLAISWLLFLFLCFNNVFVNMV